MNLSIRSVEQPSRVLRISLNSGNSGHMVSFRVQQFRGFSEITQQTHLLRLVDNRKITEKKPDYGTKQPGPNYTGGRTKTCVIIMLLVVIVTRLRASDASLSIPFPEKEIHF